MNGWRVALCLLLLGCAFPLKTQAVVIDYMVIFTPAAEERAGGADALFTRITNGVAAVNGALARSGLGHISYRLVHTQRLSGNNTTNALSQAINEVFLLDPIHEIRDEHRADAVSILFETLSPGAYGNIPLSPSQARNAYTYFGVLNFGGLTTAHELGHNMGGFHDNPYPEEESGAMMDAPYAYTFVGTNGVHYKTIMSAYYYSPRDTNGQTVLVNSGHYSNPQVNCQGVPTGRSSYADMASEITYWAPIIANNYPDPIAPEITGQPVSATNNAGSETLFSVAATGTEPLQYTWFLDGEALAGATGNVFTIATTMATNAGAYMCVVSNSAGAVTSIVAGLSVRPLAIAQQVATAVNQPVQIILSSLYGAPLTYLIQTPPQHGGLSDVALPNVTYTPLPSYQGLDRIVFAALDGGQTSTPAVISIRVGHVPAKIPLFLLLEESDL